MADPYKVLGVSPSASEEEIIKAYRSLAKKYHPDINPGNAYAEKMMKEVNAAYAQIKSGNVNDTEQSGRAENRNGGTQANWDVYGWEDIFGFNFTGARTAHFNTDAERMQAARSFMETRQYSRALQVLAEVTARGAQWYYYCAVANAYTGNRVTALRQAREAAEMDPDNPNYASLVRQLEQGADAYRRSVTGYGFNLSTVGRTIVGLWLAQIVAFFCCRMC